MTRELAAHHDPAVLTAVHLGGVMSLHRVLPTYSLRELCVAAKRPGPVQRAVQHLERCAACPESLGSGSLCARGRALAGSVRRPKGRKRPTP